MPGTDPSPGNAGFRLHPGYLDRVAEERLVATLRDAVAVAPFFTPAMPRTGRPFSVRMTNLGPLGWVSDRDGGYRYQARHPETGKPWPPIPQQVLDLWADVSGYPHPPEACLVNHYAPGAKLGLHQDADEEEFAAPVVSISLGDTCLFRLGGTARGDPTRSLRLSSGDVVVLGGPARLAFHGVDRIHPGTSTLLGGWFPEGGRINLTLRRVRRPAGRTGATFALCQGNVVATGHTGGAGTGPGEPALERPWRRPPTLRPERATLSTISSSCAARWRRRGGASGAPGGPASIARASARARSIWLTTSPFAATT